LFFNPALLPLLLSTSAQDWFIELIWINNDNKPSPVLKMFVEYLTIMLLGGSSSK